MIVKEKKEKDIVRRLRSIADQGWVPAGWKPVWVGEAADTIEELVEALRSIIGDCRDRINDPSVALSCIDETASAALAKIGGDA
jgi:hypothetical protein